MLDYVNAKVNAKNIQSVKIQCKRNKYTSNDITCKYVLEILVYKFISKLQAITLPALQAD